jgi:phosphoribosylaminoimidazole carboxylase PurE protein
VGIAMGSDSDLPVMAVASETLDRFGIAHETRIVSAHRTPAHMTDYARAASSRGLRAIIAGAGGSAHLPGMLASETHLPVVGVAIGSDTANAVGSQIQMPGGKPLAFMGSGTAGAMNAALFVVRILALSDPDLAQACVRFDERLADEVLAKDDELRSLGARRYLDAK